LAASISLFVSVYLATFVGGGYLALLAGFRYGQWMALASVVGATWVSIAVCDHGRWPLGLAAPPRIIIRELLVGACLAVILIAACDALIALFTHLRHHHGNGFPWTELATVFLPAVIHEELAFRGYVFQKLLAWHRAAAYFFSAIIFAALHGGNLAVSWLALTNIALAGVMLALAYERTRRLWFPIGIHLAWNLGSGPILGYEVSGYHARSTLLLTSGWGADWLTGGAFGMEGSVCATVVEVAAIVFLFRYHRGDSGSQFSVLGSQQVVFPEN
jgi:membrane protease YdiL (CAAX protease family)